LVDTWLLVRDVEVGGERNRALNVLKSRGMAHSNQVREFVITSKGVERGAGLLGGNGCLTGSRPPQPGSAGAREQTAAAG
jgi:circadian clock protein KaiC